MYEYKKLRNELLEALTPGMKKFDFTLVRSRQAFERKLDGSRASMHLAFIPHSSDFDVVVDVAVRIDALQNLIYEGNNDISEAEKRRTYSIDVELGNLRGVGQKRWCIRDEIDVHSEAEAIVREFECIGLPFLRKYSDPKAVFRSLSQIEGEGRLYSPFPAWRCMKAVGLAYLYGNRAQRESLIAQWRAFLNGKCDAFELEQFNEFVTHIRTKEHGVRHD